MIGLYRRRKSDTTDTALDFAPSAATSGGGGLQQANMNAMQDEINALRKKLYEVSQLNQPLAVKCVTMSYSGTCLRWSLYRREPQWFQHMLTYYMCMCVC